MEPVDEEEDNDAFMMVERDMMEDQAMMEEEQQLTAELAAAWEAEEGEMALVGDGGDGGDDEDEFREEAMAAAANAPRRRSVRGSKSKSNRKAPASARSSKNTSRSSAEGLGSSSSNVPRGSISSPSRGSSVSETDYMGFNKKLHDAMQQKDRESSLGDAHAPTIADQSNNGNDDSVERYPGFDRELLTHGYNPQPYLEHSTDRWTALTELPDVMKADGTMHPQIRPMRAMVVNVPVDFFKRDAQMFHSWSLVQGAEARCRAAAAMVSMLFAGTAMGIPQGDHEEARRMNLQAQGQSPDATPNGGKKTSDPIRHVNRYTWIPDSAPQDSWPMFQMAIEDVWDRGETQVLMIRVWLFIYDGTHSTSDLFKHVIQNAVAFQDSQRAGTATAAARNKNSLAEASRLAKAGYGMADLVTKFEETVGFQYMTITNKDQWRNTLDLHAGKTTKGPGRPCVKNLASHVNCPAGRHEIYGDKTSSALGGLHPLAPEFVLNAKRADSLSFGAVHPDGTLMDICPHQLDPTSYWRDDTSIFQLPDMKRPSFWICTSYEEKTILHMPLPRPLEGSVVPGSYLMRLFVEYEQYEKNLQAGDPDKHIDTNGLLIDQQAVSRLRSLATRTDEYQRQQNAKLLQAIHAYDLITPHPAMTAALESGAHIGSQNGEKGTEFTIRCKSVLEKVAEETNRINAVVLQPWKDRQEKRLQDLATALTEDDCSDDDDKWTSYFDERQKYQERLYCVKEDLVHYHLKMLKSCFLSTKEATTIPAGYKAMFKGLEDGVKAHMGSASIAFNGGKNHTGRSINNCDRQVYGTTQEWLRNMFVDTCKIEGRDRRILDEIYLTSFETYTKTTFVLLIASEMGKGKSVRAMRAKEIFPEGWFTMNSGNTERSGMNGNNSPSNGTVVVCDEIIQDLTPADPGPRMEFWKTILTKREYEIERTVACKQTDGTEAHTTFKVVTDHHEAFIICHNMGHCFTIGDMEPVDGKKAMIQRTITVVARAEADNPSSDSQFRSGLNQPETAAMVEDFRLFTSLVGFVRLSIMNMDWLQPDLSFAKMVFKEADDMLEKEHNQPRPEPRKQQKREENLITMCCIEAVARVYLWKQTAVAYNAGKPDENARGKPFKIEDLWDVIRTLRPTREMIVCAWSHSLEYSIGTSSYGVNTFTAACEKVGLHLDHFLRKHNQEKMDELKRKQDNYETAALMRSHTSKPAGGSDLATASDGDGATVETLRDYSAEMRKRRIIRNEYLRTAFESNYNNQKSPLEAMRYVLGAKDVKDSKVLAVADSMFPTVIQAMAVHKPSALIKWSCDEKVDHDSRFRNPDLKFRSRTTAGRAEVNDFAWAVLHSGTNDKTATWDVLAKATKTQETPTLFDMHTAGLRDSLFLLSTPENNRYIPEQQLLPYQLRPEGAYASAGGRDKDDATFFEINHHLNGKKAYDVTWASNFSAPANTRPAGSRYAHDKVELQKTLDTLMENGRVPALQPYCSSKIVKTAPIRRMYHDNTIEINLVAAMDHLSMIAEAVMKLSSIPGLKNMQERFQSGGKAPDGLKAPSSLDRRNRDEAKQKQDDRFVRRKMTNRMASLSLYTAEGGDAGSSSVDNPAPAKETDEVIYTLPWSIDIMPIAWTMELIEKFYSSNSTKSLSSMNQIIKAESLGKTIDISELPEMTTRYPGYPSSAGDRTEALRLISKQVSTMRPAGQPEVDISASDPRQTLDAALFRYETQLATGDMMSTDADIEEHRKNLIGDGFVWGTQGDIYDLETWVKHTYNSMCGRGNTAAMIDESTGAYTDTALSNTLDAEYMFQARLFERRVNKRAEGFKHYGNVGIPCGSTYTYLEKHPILRNENKLLKRTFMDAPLHRNHINTCLMRGLAANTNAAMPQTLNHGGFPRSQSQMEVEVRNYMDKNGVAESDCDGRFDRLGIGNSVNSLDSVR